MDRAISVRLLEPVKHRTTSDGISVLTEEWKEWRQKRRSLETKPKETRTKKKITRENHSWVWKEVAYHPESGKRVFFCACMSHHGDPYKGCGAVGIQQTRTSTIHEVIGSRFE